MVRAAVLGMTVLLCGAEPQHGPHGLYCGGKERVYEGALRASRVTGIVRSAARKIVPKARVQIQQEGQRNILIDRPVGRDGRFRLPNIPPGKYWLGISSPGFNLHYWHVTIVREARQKIVRTELTVGT